jgi:hypothetical protein
MCRRSLVLSLVLLVFVGWLAKEVSSQAPAPPIEVAQPPHGISPPTGLVHVPVAAQEPVSKRTPNIWSMRMEQIEGRNVVRATIGKTSDIRIDCENMDVQTQKGLFVATGKVEISGTNVQCRCEKLTINLHGELLELEGAAKVSVRKVIFKEFERTAENPENILVELTGEKLTLRWPDLRVKAVNHAIPPPPKEVDKKDFFDKFDKKDKGK